MHSMAKGNPQLIIDGNNSLQVRIFLILCQRFFGIFFLFNKNSINIYLCELIQNTKRRNKCKVHHYGSLNIF